MNALQRALAAVLLAAAPVLALADDTPASRKYGEISTAGDRLTIVMHHSTVGSAIDSDRDELVPVASSQLDDVALFVIQRGLTRNAVAAPKLTAYSMRRSDTGERGNGFLAPFVCVQPSVVDIATRQVIRREAIARGDTFSAARNPDGTDAWGALSSQAKVLMIKNMLGREVQRSVTLLMGA